MILLCNIYPLPHISLSVNRIIFMHYILRGAGAIISTCSLLTRAMCMQDWLEQIAFVCFVSLDEEDDERTCPERAEQRGWDWGALKDVKRGAGKWFLL